MQATSTQGVAASGTPAQLIDNAGHSFAISYDNKGRLTALRKTTGRNLANMLVAYDTNGRIQAVRFDNGYQLTFRYRSDGAEEVTDSFGGSIMRASNGGVLVPQSVSDSSGYLVTTLQRIEALFAFVQAVPGLNPVAGATPSPSPTG
jgi:YD repeat-containing protein